MILAIKSGSRYQLKYIGPSDKFAEFIKIIVSIPSRKRDLKLKCWSIHEIHIELLQSKMEVTFDIKHVIENTDDVGCGLKLQPFPYQKEAIKFTLDVKEALIVLPCGTGKTPIMLGVYDELRRANKINSPALIVVKASIKYQWLKEVSKFTDYKAKVILNHREATLNISIKMKYREKKLELLQKDTIENKDKIKKLKEEIRQLKKDQKNAFESQFKDQDLFILNYETLKDKKVKDKLHSLNINLVMADEVHLIKSKTSDRSKALYEFAEAEYKIGATATPVGKNPEDLYGIFKFINPLLFPSWKVFQTLYMKYAGYKVVGFKNLYQLRGVIHKHTFVKTLEEVSEYLPKIVTIQRFCDMNNAQRSMNDTIMYELDELNKQEFKLKQTVKDSEELQAIEARILALQTFSQEIADAPELLINSNSDMAKRYVCGTDSPKMDLCIDIIQDILDSGEKVAIFSKFEKMQSLLTKAIRKEIGEEIGIAYISGQMSAKEKDDSVVRFQSEDDCKILLLSDAGCEGINLEKTKYLIEYEPAVGYHVQTQRQGRIQRASSVHAKGVVYQLICNDSWDEIQLKIIDKKEEYDNKLIR